MKSDDFQKQKADVKKLRQEVDVRMVLEYFGATPDPKDPKRNWRTAAGERMTVTDQKFYNHDQDVGGGGSIDIAIHLSGCNFKEAIAMLADIAGHPAAVSQYQIEAAKHAQRIIDTTRAPDYKHDIPKANPRHLPRVIKYLTEERDIDRQVVERSVEKGRLWADSFCNAVFSLHDPELTGKQTGAELRGTISGKPFHGVRGEEKGFFFTGDHKSMVAVFVEAGIDALSYESIDSNALVVSTTGSRKETLEKVAESLQKRGYKIVAGFDVDKTGDRLTKILQDKFGEENVERRKPDPVALAHFQKMTGEPGKDWNDQVRAQADMKRVAEALKEQTKQQAKAQAKPKQEQEQTR